MPRLPESLRTPIGIAFCPSYQRLLAMTSSIIFALSGLSDGGERTAVTTFLVVLLAFAPFGVLLSGGWSVIGGLIWLTIDGVIIRRLWSSVVSWGQRRRWPIEGSRAMALVVGLSAYLILNLIVAVASGHLHYSLFHRA